MDRVFETAGSDEVRIRYPYCWRRDKKSTRTKWKVVTWS